MGTSEILEEFSDWDEVSNPDDSLPSTSPINPQKLEFKLRENYYSDGSSIFPPNEHEGLPVLLPTDSKSSSEEDTLSISSLSGAVSDVDQPTRNRVKPDSKLSINGISTFGGKMFRVLATNFRCQISSIRRGSIVVPGAVLAVALFACLKFLQWKNRLTILIREKDQRISQLMSQIAHMNEMLSTRRKVPILRIN